MKPSAIADALKTTYGISVGNKQIRNFLNRVAHGEIPEHRRLRSGRPLTSCSPDNSAMVRDVVGDEPTVPATVTAKRTRNPRTSVQRILKKRGFILVSKVSSSVSVAYLIITLQVRVHCVNEKQQRNRAECCQRLLPKLNDEFVKRIVCSDEKLFSISPSRYSNKGGIWTTLKKNELSPSVLQSPRSTSQRNLMVWAEVSWNGKTKLLFVEPGLKINAEYYVQQLREGILSSCGRLYRDGSFVLQQNWAPAHASRKTLAFLDSVGVEYHQKKEYPSESPDLNQLDYRMWAELNRIEGH
uniref:DDE_3 domain-containing protein n=1 Tax=Haemonchus contortus TaxID=6289 RepID=A0A7I4Z2Y2_HAECO